MGKLNAVSGKSIKRNTWCGPAAISIITGLGYDEAIDLLKRVTGKRAIRGVSRNEMFRALQAIGWDCKDRWEYTKEHRPTLAWWLRQRGDEEMDTTFLVNVTGHYVVVRGRKIADNLVMAPVWLREYPHRRKRVKVVWSMRQVPTAS